MIDCPCSLAEQDFGYIKIALDIIILFYYDKEKLNYDRTGKETRLF